MSISDIIFINKQRYVKEYISDNCFIAFKMTDNFMTCVMYTLLIILVVYLIWQVMRPRFCMAQKSGMVVAPNDLEVPAPGITVSSVDTSGDDSFNGYLKGQALESTVEEEHKTWLGAIPMRTMTSSHDVILTSDNDVNPWVGLRRPDYHKVIPDAPDVRVSSSEGPEQMPRMTHYLI